MPQGMAPAGASLSAASVPDSESLRRALLMASWQRDQEVGRRRLRQRWAAWAAQRIGLAALIAGGAGWAVLSLQPEAVDGAMARLMSYGAPAAGVAATPRPQATATPTASVAPAPLDTRSAGVNASAASAAGPVARPAADPEQAMQPTRPTLRLDLNPLPASTDSTPQLSTPGDTRT